MKQTIYVFLTVLVAINLQAQTNTTEYSGTYGNWTLAGEALTTELELRSNGTFRLRSVDNVYPQTFKYYTNEGVWIIEDKDIILNPSLKKRKPIVEMVEKTIGLQDSIEIKVNHYNEIYQNQKLIEKKKT